MEEHLIIGDIHGKLNVMHAAEKSGKSLIFVGDFLDDFDNDPKYQIACLTKLFQMQDSGQAKYVLGNHEWSYVDRRFRCSGYKPKTQMMLIDKIGRLRNGASQFIKLGDDVLITHAGIHKNLWERQGFDINHLEWRFIEAERNPDSWYHQVGYSRGGRHRYGGPLWCDWNMEFVPVGGVRQVVGHTRSWSVPANFKQRIVEDVRTNKNGDWCIDGLDENGMCVIYTGGEIKPFKLL